MSRIRAVLALITCVVAVSGATTPAATAQQTSTLVAVRASHHPDYDRVVFEFTGPVPAQRNADYVPELIGDPSGLPVPVAGDAILQVRMASGRGHDDNGDVTYGPPRRTYALPNVIQVVDSGDFEGVLSFGIGLAQRTGVTVFTLTNPSRVVIDIATPFRTVPVSVHFLDLDPFEHGAEPYTRAVSRQVIPPATARGALQRLYAGPAQEEIAQRLRFVSSDATGFTDLSIVDGIARVRLTGGCSSHGATFTVAGEVFPTLKQFSSVRWVKIYDPQATPQNPTARATRSRSASSRSGGHSRRPLTGLSSSSAPACAGISPKPRQVTSSSSASASKIGVLVMSATMWHAVVTA
ncbi:AMIN-like domain-containing (lipo)protein [Lentzea nigeriaca]|uniref:AMIN-like domain-containing (lipo)protein n=1 Tax=Lentzea nigeriaca TaxID=1128665 RepID=UPI00195B9921|nr:hypothetical protein [Lentzea nigeriaca]MBM7864648.1 hypothetical protein [Lentzea nigeriaca]